MCTSRRICAGRITPHPARPASAGGAPPGSPAPQGGGRSFYGKLSFGGEFTSWQGYLALQPDGSVAMSKKRFNQATDVLLAYAADAESFVLQASNGRWVRFQGEHKQLAAGTGELAK